MTYCLPKYKWDLSWLLVIIESIFLPMAIFMSGDETLAPSILSNEPYLKIELVNSLTRYAHVSKGDRQY
jgi:hypothetical protein